MTPSDPRGPWILDLAPWTSWTLTRPKLNWAAQCWTESTRHPSPPGRFKTKVLKKDKIFEKTQKVVCFLFKRHGWGLEVAIKRVGAPYRQLKSWSGVVSVISDIPCVNYSGYTGYGILAYRVYRGDWKSYGCLSYNHTVLYCTVLYCTALHNTVVFWDWKKWVTLFIQYTFYENWVNIDYIFRLFIINLFLKMIIPLFFADYFVKKWVIYSEVGKKNHNFGRKVSHLLWSQWQFFADFRDF